jgi:putative hydrolase of HD superfamily
MQEYEEQVTPEAKLVKDLDRFDMICQAYEYERELNRPGQLEDFYNSTKGAIGLSVSFVVLI